MIRIPDFVRFVFVFQGFPEAGPIRTVWGQIFQINPAVADGFSGHAVYAGQRQFQSERIKDVGTVHLFVQLDTPGSTTLEGVKKYKVDATNITTITVEPNYWEVEVEESTEVKAKLEAHTQFTTKFGAEAPIEFILAKTESGVQVGVGGEVAGQQSTKKKFHYVVVRKGLKFSGMVEP